MCRTYLYKNRDTLFCVVRCTVWASLGTLFSIWEKPYSKCRIYKICCSLLQCTCSLASQIYIYIYNLGTVKVISPSRLFSHSVKENFASILFPYLHIHYSSFFRISFLFPSFFFLYFRSVSHSFSLKFFSWSCVGSLCKPNRINRWRLCVCANEHEQRVLYYQHIRIGFSDFSFFSLSLFFI